MLPRYSSSRHRQLMDASEFALQDASESDEPRESRIATTILGDVRKYREWEVRHADLLIPVAEHRAKKHQILALRNAEVQLVHRRALFTYLQNHEVSGAQRERLFRLFHSTLDLDDAILAEHRKYMMAVSSHISTDHIIDVMADEKSTHLIKSYEKVFARYFEMKCYVASSRDSHCIELVGSSIRDLQGQLLRLRRRIETEPASGYGGNFEQQDLFYRTGRFEIQNYLYV